MYETDILIFIIFILILVYLREFFIEMYKYFEVFVKVQGPKTVPISLLAFIFTLRSETDRFQILQNLSKKYRNFYSLWFGVKYFFITDDPSIVQKLFTYPECVEKNFFMELFGFPNGLISLKSDRWKHERKLLNPTFSLPILQSYVSIFNKCIVENVEILKQKCDKGEFDIKHNIEILVMDSVLNTVFSRNITTSETREMKKNVEKLLSIVWKRSMNPLLYYETIYSLTKLQKDEKYCRQFIFDFISKEWKQKSDIKRTKNYSFMQSLSEVSENGRNYSQEEINDHIGTMLVGASDTTSSALNFLTLMIAMHENVQDKIVKEIADVFGEFNDTINIEYEKLSELKYIEMAIKETLRLFSPATVITREVKSEVNLGNIGCGVENLSLPQGTNLIVNVHGMHRRRDIWGENAERFNPENFLPNRINERNTFSYVPFANGIRLCIGIRFAMILMKMFVVRYVSQFRFTTSLRYDDIKIKNEVTISSVGGFPVSISKRESLKSQ